MAKQLGRPRAEMRKKILWPSVHSNFELADLEVERPWIFHSWAGVLNYTDDFGRLGWEPRRIAARVYPVNPERQKSFTEDLELMVKAGLIQRYGDNLEFLCFPNWWAHNKLDNPTVSEYPEPPGYVPPEPPKPKTKEKDEVEEEGNGPLSTSYPADNRRLTAGSPPINRRIMSDECPHGDLPKHCQLCKAKKAKPQGPVKLKGFSLRNFNEPLEFESLEGNPVALTAEEVHQVIRCAVDRDPWYEQNVSSRDYLIKKMPTIFSEFRDGYKIPTKTVVKPDPACAICHGSGEEEFTDTDEHTGRKYDMVKECACVKKEVVEV